ncbi:MAG: hypothetical protein J6B46_02805, partial [Parabacteroides sp.]|nr:hypothetical protein [Parabacteroides sp.]
GVYYWTITVDGETTWLTDDKGNKLPVSGTDGENGTNGKNGVTPLLKVDGDGYWMVSYDNGSSYTYVLDSYGHKVYAVGPQGPAGSDGEDGEDGEDGNDGDKGDIGDSQFTDVKVDEENGTVTITLADGTEIVIPITGVGVTYTTTKNENVDAKAIEIEAGGSVTLKYEVSKMSNATVEVLSEKGVSVSVDESKQEITITEDNDTKTPISEAKVVLLYYNDEQTLTSVLKFKEAWSEDAGDKKVRVNSVYYETIEAALEANKNESNITVELAEGEFEWPNKEISKTLTVKGADKKNTVVVVNGISNPDIINFENLTMSRTPESSYSTVQFSHAVQENYTNCIIKGSVRLLVSESATFNNCEFYNTEESGFNGYSIHYYGYDKSTVNVNNCTFTTVSKAICVYNEGAIEFNLNVNGCKFTASKTTTDKAAIQMHTEKGIYGTLTVNNSTATGFADINDGLWNEVINSSDNIYKLPSGTNTNNFVKTIDGVTYATVSTNEDLEKVLDYDVANLNVELGSDVTVDVYPWEQNPIGGSNTKTVSINGNNKYTLTFNQTNSDWNHIIFSNSDATLVLKDLSVTNTGENNGPWNRHNLNFACKVKMDNVTSDKAIALGMDAVLNKVVISDVHPKSGTEVYGIWIKANGQTVTMTDCEIKYHSSKTGDRGIKISDEYISDPQLVNLSVSDTKFVTQKKAAILVGTLAGAKISLSNINIEETSDKTNAVWIDNGTKTEKMNGNNEKYSDYKNLVTVTGGSFIVEP